MNNRVTLPGTNRKAVPGAKVTGTVDLNQRIEITVQVRRKRGAELDRRVKEINARPIGERKYLTRAELADVGGADPADFARIDAFAEEYGLTVEDASVARRTVRLSGTIADMNKAFGVKLKRYKKAGMTYRGRTGSISIPSELSGVVERVLGLDDRPTTTPHYRRASELKGTSGRAGRARNNTKGRLRVLPKAAKGTSYTPLEIAAFYDFPAGLDGSGQTVALIELNDVDNSGKPTGTGYAASDLSTYFKSLGISPAPNVTAVGVDGGANVPGPDPDADGEVTLDIEVAGAIAPGAKYAVYFGTNTDDGFLQAVTAAIHDDMRKPSVISISWGQAEETTTAQLLDGLQQAFEDAAALGVTVCVAAGDSGSADMPEQGWDGKTHVDFPCSSPYALACGGTTLDTSSKPNTPKETVWNRGSNGGATGGGVSNFFAKPDYQANVKVPAPAASAGGRGVPDVSGDADPYTGYSIYVGGQKETVGGTSAVAPLWAGLVARMNQSLAAAGKGPVGFINPTLYANARTKSVFHDVTSGNNDIYDDLNGEYTAGTGWDACTGLGSVDGAQLLEVIGATGTAKKAGA